MTSTNHHTTGCLLVAIDIAKRYYGVVVAYRNWLSPAFNDLVNGLYQIDVSYFWSGVPHEPDR